MVNELFYTKILESIVFMDNQKLDIKFKINTINHKEEILSNPKYGNNGKFVEVWMMERRAVAQDIRNIKEWFETIQRIRR